MRTILLCLLLATSCAAAPPRATLPKFDTPATVVQSAPWTFHTYEQVVSQLVRWHREAPAVTQVGTYGDGVYCLRLYNHTEQPRVVLTGAIHGNEVLAAMLVLQYAGEILKNHQYLLKNREIYFVPVFSPKSYPDQRHVYGVDPNRNFPDPYVQNRPVPHIAAFCNFVARIKPKAVLSGHCMGRVFLVPWGDSNDYNPNYQDYVRVAGQMAQQSGYRVGLICRNYGHPIYGTEADWCHRQGAFSFIMESGTVMGVPSDEQIVEEFRRTLPAILTFIKLAPEVQVVKGSP